MAGGKSAETQKRNDNDRTHARCAWLIATDLAARAFGADVRVVIQSRGTVGRGGDDKTSKARKVACYLACVKAGASPQRLAEASGLDRKTIYKHLGWVEDEKDRPAFHRQVEEMEEALVGWAAQVVLNAMPGFTPPYLLGLGALLAEAKAPAALPAPECEPADE